MNIKKFLFIFLVALALSTKIISAAEIPESWLTKLGNCESRNRDDITTLDSNNKYSYGRYQFQELTWKNYIKKYNLLPYAEVGEYMNWIYDGKIQREVTIRVLNEKNGWTNWRWCATNTGLRQWLTLRGL